MSGLKWTSVFGASYIFLMLSKFSGVVSKPRLATITKTAQEEMPFSLSCFKDSVLFNVEWIRNKDIIFRTKPDSNDILDKTERFKDVSGRITVSTSLKQHNVTLWINSTLDHRSEWWCKSGGAISNTVYINITHTVHTTVPSSSTSKATTVTFSELSSTNNILTTVAPSTSNKTDIASSVTDKPSNKNEKLIYIIVASAGGVAVVIVIAVVICVVCVRKKCTQNKRRSEPVYEMPNVVYQNDEHTYNVITPTAFTT